MLDSPYDPRTNPYWLGDDEEESEEEILATLDVQEELATIEQTLPLFAHEGWANLYATLAGEINAARERMESGFAPDGRLTALERYAEERGRIRAFRKVMQLPERLRQEQELLNERLTKRPDDNGDPREGAI